MTNSRSSLELSDDQLASDFIDDIFSDSLKSEDHQKILELIQSENVIELKIFLKKFDFNILDSIAKDNLTNPIFYAIDNDKLQSIKALIEFFGVDEFFKQKFGPDKLNPIFYSQAIHKHNAMRVLIQSIDQQTTLEMNDSHGDNLLILAFRNFQRYEFSDPYKRYAQHNLELILKKICGDDAMLDIKLSQLAQFYESYSYLRLGYTENSYPEIPKLYFQNKKNLEDLGLSSQVKIFKEVNDKIITHRNAPLPIKAGDQDQENLYIYSSKLKNHSSYFVIHANQQNNKILAISYVDGNSTSSANMVSDLDLCYGVIKFNLPTAVSFESQDQLTDIVDNFIANASKNKMTIIFYKNLARGNIEFCNQKFSDCIQEQSLPIRPQKRGNCILKSNKVLQRFLITKLDPQISFEYPVLEGKKDGRKLFKTYKKELKDNAIAMLEDLSQTFSKDNIFENLLLNEKAKLMKRIEEKTSIKQVQSLKRKERLQSKIKSLTPLSSKSSLSCVIS